jgi:hypothetical protein
MFYLSNNHSMLLLCWQGVTNLPVDCGIALLFVMVELGEPKRLRCRDKPRRILRKARVL